MNEEKMLHMLEYSSSAYLDDQTAYPCDVMHTIDDEESGVQCYIRIKGKSATITFRGTNSSVDRYKNLMFCRKCNPYENVNPKICVHSGFLSAYKNENVRERIHSIVEKGAEHVTLTGHSLGAAMAVLCALDLQYNFPKIDYEVYLYGCPRVGNAAFKRSYNKRLIKTVRVENGNDIVCKVPPALFGYRHVGSCFHIGKSKKPFAVSFLAHYPNDYYEKMLATLFSHRC